MTESAYCAVLVLDIPEKATGLDGVGIETLSLINPS